MGRRQMPRPVSFRKKGKKGKLRNKGFLFRKKIKRLYESSHSAMSIILIPSTWLSGCLVRAITIFG